MAILGEFEQPRESRIVGQTRDPDGIRVVLLDRVWHGKIVLDHPEMRLLMDEVLRTVSGPVHSEFDPVCPDRVRCYSRSSGPSEWLLVVVSYEQAQARIISAFANRKDPSAWSE